MAGGLPEGNAEDRARAVQQLQRRASQHPSAGPWDLSAKTLALFSFTRSTRRQSKQAGARHACAASAAVFGRTPMNLPVSSRTGMLAFLPTELCTATDRLHSPCC